MATSPRDGREHAIRLLDTFQARIISGQAVARASEVEQRRETMATAEG
jgi:hypothetical protein